MNSNFQIFVININDILNFLHNPQNIVVFHFGCRYIKRKWGDVRSLAFHQVPYVQYETLFYMYVEFVSLLCVERFFFPRYSALHFSPKTDNPIYLTILFPWFHYLEWFIRRTLFMLDVLVTKISWWSTTTLMMITINNYWARLSKISRFVCGKQINNYWSLWLQQVIIIIIICWSQTLRQIITIDL